MAISHNADQLLGPEKFARQAVEANEDTLAPIRFSPLALLDPQIARDFGLVDRLVAGERRGRDRHLEQRRQRPGQSLDPRDGRCR